MCIRDSDDWEEFVNSSTDQIDHFSEPTEEPANNTEQLNSKAITDSKNNNDDDDDDGWTEADDRPSGVTDTLLQEPDMTENVEIMSFAPGEGNGPLGIFMDKESEFLSFPTIYSGQTRADNKERTTPVHYSTVCKRKLR